MSDDTGKKKLTGLIVTFVVFLVVGTGLGFGAKALFGGGHDHADHSMEKPASGDSMSGMDRSGEPATDGSMSGMDMGGEPTADAPGPEAADAPAPAGVLLDLGNAKCPIMGGDVNGKTYTEWNGLRVGHCCPPCAGKFLAKPEESLDAKGIEWRDAAEMAKRIDAATGAEQAKLLEEAAKRWKIVREPDPVAPPGMLVELGNAKCPIMGGDVNGKTFSEWNGLLVGHCCPPCKAEFLADPVAALDDAGIEWRSVVRKMQADAAEGE